MPNPHSDNYEAVPATFSWDVVREAKRPILMGILNITPDSFSDGGLYLSPDDATQQAQAMIAEGAALIDIGAESSRPGSQPIAATEELARLIPPLEAIIASCATTVSVDTYKAEVAAAALSRGASIINDIWGLQKDPDMAAAIAQHHAGVVIMHNQASQAYPGDIMASIVAFFEKSLSLASAAGIDAHKIILDPGIGFGKTTAHNLEVMARIGELISLGYPLLLGASRKSVIGNTLNLQVQDRLVGTLATSVYGLVNAVSILRVHDVHANRLAAAMTQAILDYRHDLR